MTQIILVAAGGAAGAACRYIVTLFISRVSNQSPVYTGTVAVNLAGSFIMGILFGHMLQNPVIPDAFILIFATGFLGSFTTFSTFAFEVQKLLIKPFTNIAIYLLLQMAAAMLLAAGGMLIGSNFTGGTFG